VAAPRMGPRISDRRRAANRGGGRHHGVILLDHALRARFCARTSRPGVWCGPATATRSNRHRRRWSTAKASPTRSLSQLRLATENTRRAGLTRDGGTGRPARWSHDGVIEGDQRFRYAMSDPVISGHIPPLGAADRNPPTKGVGRSRLDRQYALERSGTHCVPASGFGETAMVSPDKQVGRRPAA
jgi:hypothetical protein